MVGLHIPRGLSSRYRRGIIASHYESENTVSYGRPKAGILGSRDWKKGEPHAGPPFFRDQFVTDNLRGTECIEHRKWDLHLMRGIGCRRPGKHPGSRKSSPESRWSSPE